MKLENMLKAVNAQHIIGDTNLEVNGIHMDSRMVTDITISPKLLKMEQQ